MSDFEILRQRTKKRNVVLTKSVYSTLNILRILHLLMGVGIPELPSSFSAAAAAAAPTSPRTLDR